MESTRSFLYLANLAFSSLRNSQIENKSFHCMVVGFQDFDMTMRLPLWYCGIHPTGL